MNQFICGLCLFVFGVTLTSIGLLLIGTHK